MKLEWDLTHLYKNFNEWQSDYILLKEKLDNLKEIVIDSSQSVNNLISYLDLAIEVNILIEKTFCYAKRHVDLDSTLEEFKSMMNDVLKLYSDFQNISNRFENLLIENKDRVLKFLEDKNINKYKRYLSLILRRADHIIIKEDFNFSSKMQTLKDSYRELVNEKIEFKTINIDGEEVLVNRKNFENLMVNDSQENRKKAFDTYNQSFIELVNPIFDIYKRKLLMDINYAKEEKYESLLSKKLFELELDEKIVSNLIETINNNLEIMHKYIELKKSITGIEDYHLYDTAISICNIPKIEYEFQDALEIIKNSLTILGDDYTKVIDKMFEEGWVDVYPQNNKRSMSFTAISYVGVPYILLNYNKSINSLKTIAHEIGHGYNVYASKMANDFIYFECSYFLTEIASKVNELLVSEYMLNSSLLLEEKKYILNALISNLGNSLFDQVMFTEFEDKIISHLSLNDISVDEINNLYLSLMKKYYGNALIYDENVKYGWLKIPHFVMQDTYYMYQYSIGMAIATSIVYRLLNDKDNFVLKYKKFLSVGNSISISEALKIIDINLEDNTYLLNAIDFLNDNIEKMKKLVKENC